MYSEIESTKRQRSLRSTFSKACNDMESQVPSKHYAEASNSRITKRTIIGIVVLIFSISGVIFVWRDTLIPTNPALVAAVEAMNGDPRVVKKLGFPIKLLTGSLTSRPKNSIVTAGGDVVIVAVEFKVTGSLTSANGSGTIKSENGNWYTDELEITFRDGSTAHLPQTNLREDNMSKVIAEGPKHP